MRADIENDILSAETAGSLKRGPSFAFSNRVYRALWQVTWLLFASWTPPGMHGWRRLVLKMFGANIAPTAGVYSSARIWSPRNLIMEEWSTIGPRVIVYSMAPIRIGSRALISQGAHLCAAGHDIEDVNFQLKAVPIVVGNGAWIAADAFVGPGVRIGEGSVLGARACTFSDLEPWSVYVGNPARRMRGRVLRERR